jgi:hypothetical protein
MKRPESAGGTVRPTAVALRARSLAPLVKTWGFGITPEKWRRDYVFRRDERLDFSAGAFADFLGGCVSLDDLAFAVAAFGIRLAPGTLPIRGSRARTRSQA